MSLQKPPSPWVIPLPRDRFINVDAIFGRLLFRWPRRTAALLAFLLGFWGISSGIIPPIWRGQGKLTIHADPHMTVLVDGKAWPRRMYGGIHMIEGRSPDHHVWSIVDLQAEQALTVTLPSGLRTPRIRQIPPAAPGTEVSHIWWANHAWRVRSRPVPVAPDPNNVQPYNAQPSPPEATTAAEQTVALTVDQIEPLATLDAYGGKADVAHVGNSYFEAIYQSEARSGSNTPSTRGTIEVRGWGDEPETVVISRTVTLVRFSPDGRTLVVGEQLSDQSEQLYLLQQGRPLQPLVAIPGATRELIWDPDGRGVVVVSEQRSRRTLTLCRIKPTVTARVITEVVLGSSDHVSTKAAIFPLTWNGGTVEWIAPDGGIAYLWSAPLTSLIPERREPMKAIALQRLKSGGHRVVTVQNQTLVIGQYRDGVFVAETTIPNIPVDSNLVGQWSPTEEHLVLQNGSQAWIIQLHGSSDS